MEISYPISITFLKSICKIDFTVGHQGVSKLNVKCNPVAQQLQIIMKPSVKWPLLNE